MADPNDKEVEGRSLQTVVDGQIAEARQYQRSELDGERERAINYYNGYMPDIPILPNRSKQVSRDVADAISWMGPSLVRVFVASKAMVEFEPLDEEGDQWARDATEFTNYDFMRNNNGYRILRTAIDDALKLKFAVLTSYWKPPTKERETLKGLTLEQISLAGEDEEYAKKLLPSRVPGTPVKIVSQKDGEPVEALDEFGTPISQPTWDVRVEYVTKAGRICDEACKPENYYYDPRASDQDDARYWGYYFDDTTRSDLMAMAEEYGFDESVIEDLPAFGGSEDNPVTLARYQNSTFPDTNSFTKSGDIIGLYRHFTYGDLDGDGIAELIEVWFAGQRVLAWQVWEEDNPYTIVPCYPQAHRFEGESVADRMVDIQRVKTVLTRQVFDNLYASAAPQQEVDVGSVLNPDVLTNKTLGGIIWKKTNSKPIVWQQVPFYADKVLAALPYFDEMTAKRVGVSRTTMALDPDALSNQTATASNNQRDAAYTMHELVARDMAEFGFSVFFGKRLKMQRKYYTEPQTIPSSIPGEKFRQVIPAQWPDMAVNINTGLGTGSRDRDAQMLTTIMASQNGMAAQLAQNGMPDKALEFIPKIRKTAVELTEATGIRNPESYWPNFDEEDVKAAKERVAQQAQQPNPQVMLEQMKQQGDQQLEQVKGQTQIQVEQVKAQVSQQESADKAQVEIVKNQAQLEGDLAANAATLQNQVTIETLKQDREDRRFFAKLASEEQLKREEMQLRAVSESARLAQTEANAKVSGMNGSTNAN